MLASTCLYSLCAWLLLVMIHTGGFDVVSKALCVVALFDDVQSVAQRVKFNRRFAYLGVQLVTLTTHLVLLERIVHHHLPQTTHHLPQARPGTIYHRHTRHRLPQTTHHLPPVRPGTTHHRPDTVYHRPDTIYHRHTRHHLPPASHHLPPATPGTIHHRPDHTPSTTDHPPSSTGQTRHNTPQTRHHLPQTRHHLSQTH